MKIIHLQNKEIDRSQWDNCIAMSQNQLSYAFSWYLDVVSPNWEALVSADFLYVMPLPVKCKFGIRYIVQPILCQQLGVFSTHKISEEIVAAFIKKIPYHSYAFNLNEKNAHPNFSRLPNFILNLNQSYSDIYSSYSKNTCRNIERASKLNLKVKIDLSVLDFYEFYYHDEREHKPVNKLLVKQLIEKGVEKNLIKIYGIYSAENQLISAVCMLISADRISYLLPISNEEGKASSAMFLLIDKIIKTEAEKDLLFDFEGSQIEGIARFNKGFGAKNQPYYTIKRLRPSFLVGNLDKL